MPIPPVRADHVGSLLRPQALKRAHSDYREKHIDAAQLQARIASEITEAVKLQETTGLRVITDGEFRRGSWFLGLVEAVDGIALEKVAFQFGAEGVDNKSWHGPAIRGRLKRARPIVVDDFNFLRSVTTQIPKVTLPTPSVLHFFGGENGIDRTIYPDIESFFADLAVIYRAEIADLHAAGCRYLQLDEVPLTLLCDPLIREQTAARGQDPDRLIDLYIQAANDALTGRPADLCVVMHLCRGNYRGRWMGRVATSRSPNDCSMNSTSTAFCSSSTASAPALLSRCVFCPPANALILGSSVRKRTKWRMSTIWRGGWTKRFVMRRRND